MVTTDDTPPVYLFTIDSLRADFFDQTRFPRCWGRFAGDFVRFSKAYANGVATPLAFPSILADDHVRGNGVIAPSATTLAERLPGPSVAIPNNVHLSPERGYHRGFTQFDIEIDLPGYLRRALALRSTRRSGFDLLRRRLPFVADPVAPLVYRPAERMVYELRRSIGNHSPSFVWGHFMDPHGPYHPALVLDRRLPVSVDGYHRIHERWRANADIDSESLAKLTRVYEEKIRYLDRRLDGLLDWLQRAGWYDEALIIVTADHGQLIGEGGRFGHDWDDLPVDELLRVPLLVKNPGESGSGQVRSHPVQHLDIHATVAESVTTDADVDPESIPLYDTADRFIVAKSNGAVRGISNDGEAIRQSDGPMCTTGDPPRALVERVETAEPANVTTDVGQETMTEAERRRVNERLEGLGYR